MENEKYCIIKVKDKDGSEKYIARTITHSKLTENIADACFIDINHEIFKEYSNEYEVLETIPVLYPGKTYVLKFRNPRSNNEYLMERDPVTHYRVMKEVSLDEATKYTNLHHIMCACNALFLDPVEI